MFSRAGRYMQNPSVKKRSWIYTKMTMNCKYCKYIFIANVYSVQNNYSHQYVCFVKFTCLVVNPFKVNSFA